MGSQFVFRLFLRLYVSVLLSPLYATYGAFELAGVVYATGRRLVRLRHVFRLSLSCPQGHVVPVTGRFACATCRAESHSWIGSCGVCGAGAELTRCPTCGVGVALPWSDPS